MAAEVVTALVAASGALVLAGATYWFTKQREREAELRKEKLEHYKDFVASLSGVISGDANLEGQRAFASACNKLNLVAPHAVLRALQAFLHEIKIGHASRSQESHNELMSALFFEIRRDLGVSPQDDERAFKVSLWARPPHEAPSRAGGDAAA
ncbi:hypothetical protein [Solimonas flava]|uniref:hypothetical protein n=1 Tax=Solimonas flava TaxID=415849 RepID=UPI0012B5AEB2|nr:hypothetical protein [Solimonas flava]